VDFEGRLRPCPSKTPRSYFKADSSTPHFRCAKCCARNDNYYRNHVVRLKPCPPTVRLQPWFAAFARGSFLFSERLPTTIRFFDLSHWNHTAVRYFANRVLKLNGCVVDAEAGMKALFYVTKNALAGRHRDIGD
jgi:hypothetical protein